MLVIVLFMFDRRVLGSYREIIVVIRVKILIIINGKVIDILGN